MKLNDIKERVDKYFENISPEDLFQLAVIRYGFSEITFDLEDETFETTKVSQYTNSENRSEFNNTLIEESCSLPLAA